MKILLSGASGFIGRRLLDSLIDRGHSVTALGRNPESIAACEGSDQTDFIHCELENPPAALLHNCADYDLLIHGAWGRLGNYRDTWHFEENLHMHREFLTGLVEAGLPQITVLGTCLEYGFQEGALSEEAPCQPVLAYPRGKHALHEYLLELQQSREFRLQWLRLFYIYGPDQRGKSLFSQLQQAIDDGLDEFAMSPGDQVRDYIHVDDLAGMIAEIAENPNFDGTVNCSGGQPDTVLNLVRQYIAHAGASITPAPGRFDYPDYEPFQFWADTTRLETLVSSLPTQALFR
jgi:dTDP-6-deoxy-L-talose 4-dehydrogenase (NAD+)